MCHSHSWGFTVRSAYSHLTLIRLCADTRHESPTASNASLFSCLPSNNFFFPRKGRHHALLESRSYRKIGRRLSLCTVDGMVLKGKCLDYDLKPCSPHTKPSWLLEHYEGKMPVSRHRKECHVESNVVADYVDFFFPEPPLKRDDKEMEQASEAIAGFFERWPVKAPYEPSKNSQACNNVVIHRLNAPAESHHRLSLLDCLLDCFTCKINLRFV